MSYVHRICQDALKSIKIKFTGSGRYYWTSPNYLRNIFLGRAGSLRELKRLIVIHILSHSIDSRDKGEVYKRENQHERLEKLQNMGDC